MDTTQHNPYFERIDRVLARLQQAIATGEELPGLGDLAVIANLSPSHFHRIYRAMTGETIGRTVTRLRMLRALHLLGQQGVPVTEVALSVGYETSQAFARAFRDAVGDTPSVLREQAAQRETAIARLSRPPGHAAAEPARLVVDVVSIEPFEVIALRRTGAFADLDQGYIALFTWATEAGVVDRISGLYGIPIDDHRETAATEYEFDCAVRLDADDPPPPAPMRRLLVAGGEFACTRHVGAFENIEDQVDRVLAHWLPASGMALRDAPIHHHFLDDPEQVPEALLRTDIYLPVRACR